ncbi:MAG TPA: 3-hydroxyacyl-CoA dehydrogenase family protein, partial [Rudaea sp.]|nr:3-hydroxyacyl-CoA dehydrogenase family protein [Rudaea sp.]
MGAGTMGGGIAMVLANAGIPVLLKETDQTALDRGLAGIRRNYASSVARGRFTQPFVDERLNLIRPTLTYDGFEQADIVIEAVFESMALKKQVFAELDRIANPGAILATNTSTLNVDEIASATSRAECVIGTHFFSPANVMRLLEIVRGKMTSKPVIATAMQLAKRVGKIGVLVGNCRGFVGNRMFHQ